MGMILLTSNISRSNRLGHVRAPEEIVSLQHELQDEAPRVGRRRARRVARLEFSAAPHKLSPVWGLTSRCRNLGGSAANGLLDRIGINAQAARGEIVTWLCQAAGHVVDTAWRAGIDVAPRLVRLHHAWVQIRVRWTGCRQSLRSDDRTRNFSDSVDAACRPSRTTQHLIALAGHAAASARGWLQR